MNTYPTTIISNTIVKKSITQKQWVTPIKLQKLLFLVEAYGLAILDYPITDEIILVGEYGPTFKSVIDDFGYRGNRPIVNLCPEYNLNKDTLVLEEHYNVISKEDDDIDEIISRVLNVYGCYTQRELSCFLRVQDSPWDICKKQSLPYIPNHVIKTYYKENK